MALRAVAPGETPAPMSVTQAAETGTQRDLLVAMRARIAKAVDDPKTLARDLASLTKRLNEVAREIKAIDARDQQEAGKSGPTADEDWSAI